MLLRPVEADPGPASDAGLMIAKRSLPRDQMEEPLRCFNAREDATGIFLIVGRKKLEHSHGMNWAAALLLVFSTSLPAIAEDWTTTDGKKYEGVTPEGFRREHI